MGKTMDDFLDDYILFDACSAMDSGVMECSYCHIGILQETPSGIYLCDVCNKEYKIEADFVWRPPHKTDQ